MFPLQQFKGKLPHKDFISREQIFQLDTLGTASQSFYLSQVILLGGRGSDLHLPYKPHIWSQGLFLFRFLFLLCVSLSLLTQKCHHKALRSFLSILTLHHYFVSDQCRRKCDPAPLSMVVTPRGYPRWTWLQTSWRHFSLSKDRVNVFQESLPPLLLCL